MADKSNPFRDQLYEELGKRGINWVRVWPNGTSIELYTWDARWLALMVYQSRPAKTWWGMADHLFTPMRALELKHSAYRIVGVFQNQPDAGTVVTGPDVEELMRSCYRDHHDNIKVFPADLTRGTYLRGAERIVDLIQEVLRECPPDPSLTPDDLIPFRPRKRRVHRAWMAALFTEEETPTGLEVVGKK
jgi:hypothetical protein